MRHPTARCYICSNETELNYVDFNEWVCKKDYDRITKFLNKIKNRKTRYKSAETWKGAHGL